MVKIAHRTFRLEVHEQCKQNHSPLIEESEPKWLERPPEV
jgi:hypothetical protein